MTTVSLRSQTFGIEHPINADDEMRASKRPPEEQDDPVKVKKDSLGASLKLWWSGLGLDLMTFLMMLK
jgi:hypothetical protein